MVHMGFALRVLSSFSSLRGPLQCSGSLGLAPQSGQRCLRPAPAVPAGLAAAAIEPPCAAPAQAANDAPARPAASARPLRVILRQQDDGACRLLISGRMADVCAELDRLALH